MYDISFAENENLLAQRLRQFTTESDITGVVLFSGFIRFSTGRQTCPNPDSPNKGGEFPKGNDPNAMQVMIDELGMTREEGVVLLGE